MELRSQAVKHAAFGKGIITEVSGNTITVCFAQGEKKFPCPDAFIHHLTLKDAALQAATVHCASAPSANWDRSMMSATSLRS